MWKKIIKYATIIITFMSVAIAAIFMLRNKVPINIPDILKVPKTPPLPEVDVKKEQAIIDKKVNEEKVRIIAQAEEDAKNLEKKSVAETVSSLSEPAKKKIEDIKTNAIDNAVDAIMNDLN